MRSDSVSWERIAAIGPSVIGWLALYGTPRAVAPAEALVRLARPQIVLRDAWQAALQRLMERSVR